MKNFETLVDKNYATTSSLKECKKILLSLSVDVLNAMEFINRLDKELRELDQKSSIKFDKERDSILEEIKELYSTDFEDETIQEEIERREKWLANKTPFLRFVAPGNIQFDHSPFRTVIEKKINYSVVDVYLNGAAFATKERKYKWLSQNELLDLFNAENEDVTDED